MKIDSCWTLVVDTRPGTLKFLFVKRKHAEAHIFMQWFGLIQLKQPYLHLHPPKLASFQGKKGPYTLSIWQVDISGSSEYLRWFFVESRWSDFTFLEFYDFFFRIAKVYTPWKINGWNLQNPDLERSMIFQTSRELCSSR